MSILPSDRVWKLVPSEGPPPAEHMARLLNWVACGARDDYALVQIGLDFTPQDSGARVDISKAILAPGHEAARTWSTTKDHTFAHSVLGDCVRSVTGRLQAIYNACRAVKRR